VIAEESTQNSDDNVEEKFDVQNESSNDEVMALADNKDDYNVEDSASELARQSTIPCSDCLVRNSTSTIDV